MDKFLGVAEPLTIAALWLLSAVAGFQGNMERLQIILLFLIALQLGQLVRKK